MKRTPACIAALAAIAIFLAAGPARADREDQAQQLFESATGLFQQGEYERAARRFMRAFKLVPHPNTAYNAALSWDAAQEPTRAADAFKRALDRGLEREARKRARSRLDELETQLGRVRVRAPSGARVMVGDETRIAPVELYVEPGVHDVVVVLSDGTRRVRRIHAHAGEIDHVAIEDKKGKDEAPDIAQTVGWASLGLAAVLGITSVTLEVRASRLRSDFNHSDRTDTSQRNAALRAQTWATVGWIATGVSGVAGLALVFGSSSGPETRVSLVPGGVGLSRRF